MLKIRHALLIGILTPAAMIYGIPAIAHLLTL
jgi:hypothetical protein